MELDLQHMDTATLQKLYEQEEEALHTRLLSGTSWNETADQRRYVTELSIALGQRNSRTSGHPAESQLRTEEDGGGSPV